MESVRRSCTHTQPVEVRSVWASNLDREFRMISEAINGKYHRVTFDTEFKLALNNRQVVKVHPRFTSPDERYCAIKASTDRDSIRQLGLTLSADDDDFVLVWEFHFDRFHFPAEMELEDSVQNDYINTCFFFDLLLSSSLLKNPRLTWIMFHGAYDVAYFIKLATFWSPLPESLPEFEFLVKNYMGYNIVDVKYLIKFTNNLYGGLKDIATALRVYRIVGLVHQARSDSLLTWHTFEKIKKKKFA